MHRITDNYAVSGQIAIEDVEAIASAGFRTIICNRPDNEDPGQPAADDVAAACKTHGVHFHFLPFAGNTLPIDVVEAMRELLLTADPPIFAYCRSGARSTVIWRYATLGG